MERGRGERRYELPDGLSPEEERLLLQALERYLQSLDNRPSRWALAGRMTATRQGALETRRLGGGAWQVVARHQFVTPGTETLHGRGDAK